MSIKAARRGGGGMKKEENKAEGKGGKTKMQEIRGVNENGWLKRRQMWRKRTGERKEDKNKGSVMTMNSSFTWLNESIANWDCAIQKRKKTLQVTSGTWFCSSWTVLALFLFFLHFTDRENWNLNKMLPRIIFSFSNMFWKQKKKLNHL